MGRTRRRRIYDELEADEALHFVDGHGLCCLLLDGDKRACVAPEGW